MSLNELYSLVVFDSKGKYREILFMYYLWSFTSDGIIFFEKKVDMGISIFSVIAEMQYMLTYYDIHIDYAENFIIVRKRSYPWTRIRSSTLGNN